MRQVTHALLTRPPLSHSSIRRNRSASFDLHVLSTPPAFILSQDQTLVKSVCFQSRITTSNSFLTLLFLVHLSDVRLNFSFQVSVFELAMHSQTSLLVHVGFAQSSLTHSLESKLSATPFRSAVLRTFRNFQVLILVIYCLIINVLFLLSLAITS